MNIFLGNVCVDVIILDPKWLCYTVMGSLLTPEFIKKSRPTGYYSIEELRTATSWESVDTMLPILESLGLCAKVSTTHSLIRGVLTIQSCSAGAKNFTNYVFCHPYMAIIHSVVLSKILKIVVPF